MAEGGGEIGEGGEGRGREGTGTEAKEKLEDGEESQDLRSTSGGKRGFTLFTICWFTLPTDLRLRRN